MRMGGVGGGAWCFVLRVLGNGLWGCWYSLADWEAYLLANL